MTTGRHAPHFEQRQAGGSWRVVLGRPRRNPPPRQQLGRHPLLAAGQHGACHDAAKPRVVHDAPRAQADAQPPAALGGREAPHQRHRAVLRAGRQRAHALPTYTRVVAERGAGAGGGGGRRSRPTVSSKGSRMPRQLHHQCRRPRPGAHVFHMQRGRDCREGAAVRCLHAADARALRPPCHALNEHVPSLPLSPSKHCKLQRQRVMRHHAVHVLSCAAACTMSLLSCIPSPSRPPARQTGAPAAFMPAGE